MLRNDASIGAIRAHQINGRCLIYVIVVSDHPLRVLDVVSLRGCGDLIRRARETDDGRIKRPGILSEHLLRVAQRGRE